MQTFGPAFKSLDAAFTWALGQCLQNGIRSAPRGIETLELFPVAFSISDPRRRYVSVPQRRWSIVYALGELCWHLRGSSSVDEIAHYASRWRQIASGEEQISGSSYGARIFCAREQAHSQWNDVIDLLSKDQSSRRAVLYFGSPSIPGLASAKDVACAVSLQFLIREGKLDAITTMRSNDAMLGLPYDVFLFSMLQEMAATSLGVDLGTYHHMAGSLHLYDTYIAAARHIVAGTPAEMRPMATMTHLSQMNTLLEGEAACRSGWAPCAQPQDRGYWADLLSVIVAWNSRDKLPFGEHNASSPTDSVLANLYSLRQ